MNMQVVQFFCCCYHLRTSSIVLAWLQLMINIIIIALMTQLQVLVLNTGFENIVYIGKNAIAAEAFIKCTTCFSLIWGIIQRRHLFLQPWIFLQCFENVVTSIAFVGLFAYGCILPIMFAPALAVLAITILNWYFWVCVRSTYNEDYIPSHNVWGDIYEDERPMMNPTLNRSSSMRSKSLNQSMNYPGLSRSMPAVNKIPRI